MNIFLKKQLVLFAMGGALLFVACANKSTVRFDRFEKAAGKNDFLTIIDDIKKSPKLYGEASKFLYYMDIGSLFHYAQAFDSSTVYLNEAASIYDDLFTKSLTNEAASLLTNDNLRPYRSKPSELIFMHQLMMFNYIAGNNFDDALVESRRTQLLVEQLKQKDMKDAKYNSDGLFFYMSALAYDKIGEPDNGAICLFKSVQAYQKGIVSLPDQVKDLAYYTFAETGRNNDITLLGLKPSQPKEQVAGLSRDQAEIILVGYAGRGPIVAEDQWWGTWVKDGLLVVYHKNAKGEDEALTLPAPGLSGAEYEKASKGEKTASGTTFHIKFAMPALRTFPSRSSYFTVQSASLTAPLKSIEVNNMDKLLAQSLEDAKTSVIVRTVVRVVIRTIAAQKAKEKMQTGNPLANLAINLGTDLLSDQLEKADIRTCFLVPKSIHMIRIPVTPGTHAIQAEVHSADGSVVETKTFSEISVKKGDKKFLFYSALY